jgi:methylglyoxal synthase
MIDKLGRIAFITTPEYRAAHRPDIETFVYRHLYMLCRSFEVLSTGRTYDLISEILARPLADVDTGSITAAIGAGVENERDLDQWRAVIQAGLHRRRQGIQGMIELSHDLVEGRLDAVVHLADWHDISGKPDSMVLRREANVHNVPIASDIDSARAMLATLSSQLAQFPEGPIFPPRPSGARPLEGLNEGDRVLGLIAHDAMKLEMCCFVVEHADTIFRDFDWVLATGTTGKWLKRFVRAARRSQQEADRIRLCLSGPYGGDVQIAAAVVRKLCRKVVFLQDPFTSHPHETDIRLFEQAVLLFERACLAHDIDLEFATNIQSARMILGVRPAVV